VELKGDNIGGSATPSGTDLAGQLFGTTAPGRRSVARGRGQGRGRGRGATQLTPSRGITRRTGTRSSSRQVSGEAARQLASQVLGQGSGES